MASTYLTRTPGSAGNRKTFTISTWVKLSTTSDAKSISHAGTTGGNYTLFDFDSSNQLRAIWAVDGSGTVNVVSNAVYRDTSAWYHIVFAVDTTQATESNRIKFYVNGEQITSFSSSTYPSQNVDTFHNSTSYANNIGKYISVGGSDSNFFDGSMAHYHFIDGTTYDASAFGETDATTGIWKPKTAPDVTYGTNGFFLKFENSAAFGTDSSGNDNTFTVNGTMTQTVDTPSNVFATLNPNDRAITGTAPTFSNGNLTWTSSGGGVGSNNSVRGTLGVSSGKWYWEAKWVQNLTTWGMQDVDVATRWDSNGYWFNQTGGWGVNSDGEKTVNGSVTASIFTSLSANDIVGFAYDLDNSKFYVSVNGTFVNSGDPTSGATGTGSLGDLTSGLTYIPIICNASYNVSSISNFNFGNGFFGTTAVASAQSPSDGIGIFEYEVPTGYKALCTKSINATEYD